MNKETFQKNYWLFYLNLEEEFIEISKTIPIDSINSKTFSLKYVKLLQTICSEIDVVFKRLMEFCNAPPNHKNINEYESFIEENFDDFKDATVTCYNSSHNYTEIKPFIRWTSNNSPEWWGVNNKIKHNRDELDENGVEKYKYANQENILNALGGLFILLMYFYEEITSRTSEETILSVPLPQSEIFHLENWGDYYTRIVENKFFFEIKDDGHLYLTTPDY